MTEVNKAITRIRAFVASPHGLSKSGLAKEAGLSPNALRDLDKPEWNPTAETLDTLLKVIAEIKTARKSRPRRSPERAAA